LHETRKKIVWGTGPKPCDILLVGEAPGEDEDINGKPFVGGAGRLLGVVLRSSIEPKAFISQKFPLRWEGLKRTAIINVVRCRPPGNRNPLPSEIQACTHNLLKELYGYKPKLIIPLGEIALQALTSKKGITAYQGTPLTESGDSQLLLPAFHPAYAIRQKGYLLAIINVFNKAALLLAAGKRFQRMKTRYTYDPSAAHLGRLLEEHNEVQPLGFAFDLETTGLDPYYDKLIGFSFSGIEYEAVSVALNRGDPYNDPRWKVFEPWLQDPRVPKTIQNASFDNFWLTVQDHPMHNLSWDTKLAAGMLYSDLPRDLSWLRSWYTDVLPYKEAARKRGVWNLSPEELNLYSCRDADVTWRVRLAQEADMPAHLLKAMKEITIPLTEALISIMARGVLIDKVALIEKTINIGPKLEALENELLRRGINPRSPQDVGKMLAKLGLPVKYTKKGNPKTDVKQLKKLELAANTEDQAKFINQILDYRKPQKIESTYLIGLSQRIKPDGRVHTIFDSSGTATGRLSSRNPNLQNIPDETRDLFIPDPGYYLLDADYNMLELLVAAIQAEEQVILDMIASGVYIHGETHEMLFGKPLPENYTSLDVSPAKRVTFGAIYGRSKRSIALEFKVSDTQAEIWLGKLLNKYPNLLRWREANIKEWKDQGYLTSVFGRVRYCNSITEALNFKVQSAAGDVCSTSLTRTEQASWKIKPLLAVHDEILFQVPECLPVKAAKDWVKRVMSRPIPELENYCFPISIKTGSCWGPTMEKIS